MMPWGMRSSSASFSLPPVLGILERARAFAPRLRPGQFFSHETAAAIHGMPVRDPVGRLHVATMGRHREPRAAGVVGHRLHLDDTAIERVAGLPVPAPAEVWCQLAETHSVETLVVVGDHLIGVTDALVARDLASAIDRRRRRGVARLREAVLLVRRGAESPDETRTRLALVAHGLPEPELKPVLRDPRGRFVARLDLAYPRWRVALACDPSLRTDPAQVAVEADRWQAIAREGWSLVRIRRDDVRDPRMIADRTRVALTAHGWPGVRQRPPHSSASSLLPRAA